MPPRRPSDPGTGALMRHGRFDVVHLRIDGDDVSLRYAHLVVAEPEGTDAVQWECIVVPLAFARLSMGAYALAVDTDDGRTLTGDAILVRSVNGTHVFRGAGTLAGLTDADLV